MHPDTLISVFSNSFSPSLWCLYSHFHPSLRTINNATWNFSSSVCTHTPTIKTQNKPKYTVLKIHTHTEGWVHSVSPVWFIDGHCKGLLQWRPLSCRQAHLQTSISKAGGRKGLRVTTMGCPWCQQDSSQTVTAFHDKIWQQIAPLRRCSSTAVSQSVGGWRKEQGASQGHVY